MLTNTLQFLAGPSTAVNTTTIILKSNDKSERKPKERTPERRNGKRQRRAVSFFTTAEIEQVVVNVFLA